MPLPGTASSLCSVYWDYAMTIRLEEIVYLHCHQQGKVAAALAWNWPSGRGEALSPLLPLLGGGERPCLLEVAQFLWGSLWPNLLLTLPSSCVLLCSLLATVDSGGTVVLVSQDGIQRPPLRFPKGGHLLQFLSCLENGLLPHGQLDPPLWSQRGKVRLGGSRSPAAGCGQMQSASCLNGRPCLLSKVPVQQLEPLRGCLNARGRKKGLGFTQMPRASAFVGLVQMPPQRELRGFRFCLCFPKGKVFPRLKKRNLQGPPESSSDREEEEATDYVFRILYPGIQDFGKGGSPGAADGSSPKVCFLQVGIPPSHTVQKCNPFYYYFNTKHF